jgi:hypothetical protein
VLLGEVLAGKPTKKIPSTAAISSKRTAASVARFYVAFYNPVSKDSRILSPRKDDCYEPK